MKQLFTSATLKLTTWYLLILMTISLLFSAVLFQVSTGELGTRLGTFRVKTYQDSSLSSYDDDSFKKFKADQIHALEINLFFALFYANLVIFVAGGAGSYLLARRSLHPIEEAHEAISRFTSDASHELRTPLAIMKSEIEVALRDMSLKKSDMRELLESNLEEVNRLSDLSHMLLQLSRQAYDDLKLEQVDLVELAQKAVSAAEKEKGRIELTLPKKPLKVSANRAGLTELLMIVLDNALRYSPDDSTILLAIARTDSGVVIESRNKGPGIHPDDLPHIFERFYRADKSRTTHASTGYGLGLSLAKKIVDLHQGTIIVTSKPGKTTEVKITLPCRG